MQVNFDTKLTLILEVLLFNQLYIITNTYLFLLLLCLKKKVTFEKLLKGGWGKINLRWGEMPPPPPNPPKNTSTYMETFLNTITLKHQILVHSCGQLINFQLNDFLHKHFLDYSDALKI